MKSKSFAARSAHERSLYVVEKGVGGGSGRELTDALRALRGPEALRTPTGVKPSLP